MTKIEFEQVTTSLGIIPEMRGFSVVLAAYTGPAYSDWVAIYNHNNNSAILNGYKRTYKNAPAFKSALAKLLLKNKEHILSKKLDNIKKDFV